MSRWNLLWPCIASDSEGSAIGSLMRPTIKAKRSVTREVEMYGSCHLDVRHAQLDRTQFCIELNDIEYQRIYPGLFYHCWLVGFPMSLHGDLSCVAYFFS